MGARTLNPGGSPLSDSCEDLSLTSSLLGWHDGVGDYDPASVLGQHCHVIAEILIRHSVGELGQPSDDIPYLELVCDSAQESRVDCRINVGQRILPQTHVRTETVLIVCAGIQRCDCRTFGERVTQLWWAVGWTPRLKSTTISPRRLYGEDHDDRSGLCAAFGGDAHRG